MNKKISFGNLIRDVFIESSNIKNLYARALIAASIYCSGMSVATANYTYPYNHHDTDTVVVASHPNKTVSNIDALNADTVKFNINVGRGLGKDLGKDYITGILKNNSLPDSLSGNTQSLDKIIASYAHPDNNVFVDNEYYRALRENDAFSQIKKYDIKNESTVMLVNKTFQKAMIVKMEMQPYIYSKDSLDSFIKQGRSFKISKNESDKLVEMLLEPTILFETDCSTAKTYGIKEFDGDSKTPEGIFTIYSVEDSHTWTYDGVLAYGPKFLRIKNSIGIHGNGTDTLRNKDIFRDRRYLAPEPLGLYANNFGVGRSHGCIRLDNTVVDKLTSEGVLKNGTKVIIFENKDLTETLSKHYLPNNKITLVHKSANVNNSEYNAL